MNDADVTERIPTAAQARAVRGAHTELWMQRVGAVLLAVLIALACLGVLGPKAATESDSAGIGGVDWEYPSTTRPGLDTEITVTLTPEEARDTYVVRIDQSVVAVLGIEQIHPEPSTQTARGSTLVLEFAGSDAETFDIVFSGRVPVRQPLGVTRWNAAWMADDHEVELDATTVVLP